MKHGDTTTSSHRSTSSCDSMLMSLPMLYINRTSSELMRCPLLTACKHACRSGSAYGVKWTWHSRHKSFRPSDACAVWLEFNPITSTRIACGMYVGLSLNHSLYAPEKSHYWMKSVQLLTKFTKRGFIPIESSAVPNNFSCSLS